MRTLLLALAIPAVLSAQSLKGTWEGTYKTPSSNGGELTIKIDSTKDGWAVALQTRSEYSPEVPKFYDGSGIRVKGDSISFTVTWGPQVVSWYGTFKVGAMAGGVASQYWTGTWRAKRQLSNPRP